MHSVSINYANTSGVHLNVNRPSSSPPTANIFSLALEQRPSPHHSFSVAPGNDRQYLRISSTFMSDSVLGATTLSQIETKTSAYRDQVRTSKHRSAILTF